jgi:hypothetical protein
MILKTSASYNDVMEMFAKQISTYFVTLEFLNPVPNLKTYSHKKFTVLWDV